MTIDQRYLEYLAHFGTTCPIRELATEPGRSDVIGLRHDVDICLDTALEMAYWEYRHNISSTYYLLHTTDYWQDPRFIDKCLQIQDFGHEIGLHLNVLTEWMQGETDDPATRFEQLLTPLRERGVIIDGVSAHGDHACYAQQFINYWCFEELRPDDPELAESGLSAEGVADANAEKQIRYPASHQLTRADGATFPLWSVSMKALGLRYDAMHIPVDRYFTDSGGHWTRSVDPMTQSLATGRNQVLMHPIYWRGLQKKTFIFSTARSGSTWLSTVLEEATAVMGRHEMTLNHRYVKEKWVPLEQKNTGEGFTRFMADHDAVHAHLVESRSWIESFTQDYAEANVYLVHVKKQFAKVFPDATTVHLYRNPKDVVRSVMNRSWYDTPQDTKHPVFEVANWERLSAFEKACWYVRLTNESLLETCDHALQFERMTADPDYLETQLAAMGIPFYPRLAQGLLDTPINRNKETRFPTYEGWTAEQKAVFHQIVDPINIRLNYMALDAVSPLTRLWLSANRVLSRLGKSWQARGRAGQTRMLSKIDFHNPQTVHCTNCHIEPADLGSVLIPEPEKHAHLLLGGGTWQKISPKQGWHVEIGSYYQGALEYEDPLQNAVHMMCLEYDKKGELLSYRRIEMAKQHPNPSYQFTFRPKPYATHFNLALYISRDKQPSQVTLYSFKLEKVNPG